MKRSGQVDSMEMLHAIGEENASLAGVAGSGLCDSGGTSRLALHRSSTASKALLAAQFMLSGWTTFCDLEHKGR